jgi:hypothetical protein
MMCLLSFVGFSVIVIFGREKWARRAEVAMAVSGFLAIVSLLMVQTS